MSVLFLILLIAILLFGAIVLWSRGKLRPPVIPNAQADEVVKPASSPSVSPAIAPPVEFDPNATRIYAQMPVAASVTAMPREGVTATIARAHLVCLSGPHKGATFPLKTEGIIAGRNPSCDIVMSDLRVSSRHAWIGLIDGKPVLRDLHSSNGTFLNAHAGSPVTETELRSGDMISFGAHQGDQYRFVADQSAQ